MTRLALGFREHAGWAVAVLLAEAEPLPMVIERSRIELCPTDLPREAHHAAAQLDPDGAKALVAAVTEAAADATHGAIEELLARYSGEQPLAGVPIGERPIPASPSATRKAHTMMHAAEGQLYREALAEGSARAGLTVHRFSRNALMSLAADARGVPGAEMTEALAAMGREIRAPWARDQKDAALCAWLALRKGD